MLEHHAICLAKDLLANRPVELVERGVGDTTLRPHHLMMQSRKVDFSCRGTWSFGEGCDGAGDGSEDHLRCMCGDSLLRVRGGAAEVERVKLLKTS